MKKFYDKLILLIALLALAGGGWLYMAKSSEAPQPDRPVDTQPADHPYEPVPVPETPESSADWPGPEPQSSGWLYDVFTPPKIFIDPEGNFTIEGWEPPEPEEPFGLYLADISRDVYRIQIQGYLEDRDNPDKSLVLLYDEERETTVRLQQGQTNEAAAVELVDFTVDRQIDPERGSVAITARAKIRDLRTGDEVVLTEGEVLYEEGVTVTVRSEQDVTFERTLTEEGVVFETDWASYQLLAISLEDQSITVEKRPSSDEATSEVKVLTLGPENGVNPSRETQPTDQPTDAQPPNASNAFPF